MLLLSYTKIKALQSQIICEAFILLKNGDELMPTKPKRPCSYPGCPNLTDGRFCETHAKAEAKRYETYDRDPSAKKRYNSTWRRIRDNYIKAHPLCEQCLKENKYIPAQEVHHILPLAEGGTHAQTNLVALCKSCHAKIHAERGDRWHIQKDRLPN